MKTWKTFLRSDLIPRKLSFSSILNTWVQCIQMFADSRNISTWVLSKLFSVWISVTVVEKPLIQPSKQLLAYPQHSLIFSETKIFHALFLAVSIKILISEWPEMYAENLRHQNQQDSILNSSHHCKDLEQKCQHQPQLQAFSSPIQQNRSRRKSTRQSPVVVQQKKSNKSMELIFQKTFLITTWAFSWKMIRNWLKSGNNMQVAKC